MMLSLGKKIEILNLLSGVVCLEWRSYRSTRGNFAHKNTRSNRLAVQHSVSSLSVKAGGNTLGTGANFACSNFEIRC